MPRFGLVSRLDFLRMVGTAGVAFMSLPLASFGRTFGTNLPMTSKPVIIKRLNRIGHDGVAFLYPTKQKGFSWYMNHDEPFDSHFEIGGGSTYNKLVKNDDGSWTADDNKRVKFNLNVDPDYEDAIDGCKMSFKDSMARGYTYDKSDLDNVELTGFFNVHKPTENDGIYLRGPCNHHDEADRCGNSYSSKNKRRCTRKANPPMYGPLIEAKAASGLDGDRIDVMNAVHGIEQDRPRRRVGDEYDFHGKALSPQQNRKGNERHRRNRSHEFDYGRGHLVCQFGCADQNSDRDDEQVGD